jgi:DNA-binding MarR family transcriptional regulator
MLIKVMNDDLELRNSILRLARRLRSMRYGEDVTDNQRSVLFALTSTGPHTPASLSRAEGMSAQSMNRILKSLVAREYVTRAPWPGDGRKVDLQLSKKGLEYVGAVRRRRGEWWNSRLDTLSREDREVLQRLTPILKDLAEK